MDWKQLRQDSTDVVRETRYDIMSTRLPKVKPTSQGFLRIPAVMTKVGVLTYRTPDGQTIKELRPEDEVLRQDSLDTLSLAPVTIHHHGLVNPDNVATHQVGIVGEQIRADGTKVTGHVVVQTKDAIRSVQSRELAEISPGYVCEIDRTPGTYKGERYDQIQRNIVYNHIALLPPGMGRAGAEVSLRMDAAFSVEEDEERTKTQPGDVPPVKEENSLMKITIRLDGVAYEIEVPDALAANFEGAIERVKKERQDAKDSLAKAEGSQAAIEKERDDLKTRLDAAEDPKNVEKLVSERMDVVEKAQKLAPEAKFDGMSLDEIRKTALEARGIARERLDSAESLYLQGMFETIEPKATAGAPGVSPKPPEDDTRQDSKDDRSADVARQEMIERNQKAWNTVGATV